MTDRRSLSGSLNVTAGSGIQDSEGGATATSPCPIISKQPFTSGAQTPATRPTLLVKTNLWGACAICTGRRFLSPLAPQNNQRSTENCGNAPIIFNCGRPHHVHRPWLHRCATSKRHRENLRQHPLATQLRRHAPQRHDTIHSQQYGTPHTHRHILPLRTLSPQPRWWELFPGRHVP